MKHKNIIICLLLVIVLNQNLSGFNIPEKILDLTVSSGLTWLEAYKYIFLLQDKNAQDLLGDQDLEDQESNNIRTKLNQNINYNWATFPIKVIKEDLRIYIPYALICTDSIIFINPDIYDLVSDEEKNSAILRVGIMIKEKHVRNSALFLTILPVFTHLIIKMYTVLIEDINNKLLPKKFKENIFMSALAKAHNYIIESNLLKFFINLAISTKYFNFKANKYDKKIINLTTNQKNLLKYYLMVNQQLNKPGSILYLRHPNLIKQI